MHPCVYERMQDRAHASAPKRQTACRAAYWRKFCKLHKCIGKGVSPIIIESAKFSTQHAIT